MKDNKKDYKYEFPAYKLILNGDEEPQVFSLKYNKFLQPKVQKNGYKQTTVYNVDKKPITLNYARFLMILTDPQESYENLVVDHINRDKQDDRLSNLRWITQK